MEIQQSGDVYAKYNKPTPSKHDDVYHCKSLGAARRILERLHVEFESVWSFKEEFYAHKLPPYSVRSWNHVHFESGSKVVARYTRYSDTLLVYTTKNQVAITDTGNRNYLHNYKDGINVKA